MLKISKNPSFIILILLSCSLFFTCSPGDTTPTGCSIRWATELQDELSAFSQAAVVHAQTQTETSCENMRAAAQVYLDALRPYGNCQALTGQSRSDWQNAVAEAEQDIADMDCNMDSN